MSHENLKNQLKQSSLLPRTVSIFQGTEILLQISWNMLTLMTSFLFLIFQSLLGILSWLQKLSIFWLDCWLAIVTSWACSQTVCWDVQPLRDLHQFCRRLSPVLHRFIHIAMLLSEIWFGTKLHLCTKMISSQIFWSRALRRRWKRKSPRDSWVVSIQ